MPFPFEHYYLSFGGTIAGVEEWSMGLRMSSAFTNPDRESEEAALTALSTTLKTQWALPANPCRSDVVLTWAKYNRINTEGKYANQYTNVFDYAPAVPSGASASTPMPLQIALVVTLETANTRGLAHRGRIYLPGPKWPVTTPGMVVAGTALDLTRDWVVATINALNAVPEAGNVVVASKVRTGAQLLVSGISIGNYYDTMRSRRGQVLETRVVGTITPSGVGGDF